MTEFARFHPLTQPCQCNSQTKKNVTRALRLPRWLDIDISKAISKALTRTVADGCERLKTVAGCLANPRYPIDTGSLATTPGVTLGHLLDINNLPPFGIPIGTPMVKVDQFWSRQLQYIYSLWSIHTWQKLTTTCPFCTVRTIIPASHTKFHDIFVPMVSMMNSISCQSTRDTPPIGSFFCFPTWQVSCFLLFLRLLLCTSSIPSSKSQRALPDLNRDLGHCRTSTASSGSPWARPGLNKQQSKEQNKQKNTLSPLPARHQLNFLCHWKAFPKPFVAALN